MVDAAHRSASVALVVMMGRRVQVELRIFLTAAAIVDDTGAIAVVATFYSNDLHLGYLVGATMVAAGLVLLNGVGCLPFDALFLC